MILTRMCSQEGLFINKTKGTLQTKIEKKTRKQCSGFFIKQTINDSISPEGVPNLISLHSAPNRTQISFCGQRMQRSGKTNAIILLLINV